MGEVEQIFLQGRSMMAERGRMLRLENLPPDITADKLKIILSNTRRKGGGPVDHIDLNSEEHSAIVTFRDCKAVNIILNRGNFIEIQEFEAKIFCVDDISKSLQRSETVLKNKKTPSVAMSFTEKSNGKNLNNQESYNADCGSSNRKNTCQKLQPRNDKRETHSLSESESSESSDDIHPTKTRNTNNIRVLGDQDGNKPLNRQKYGFKSDEYRKQNMMRKGHSEEESKKFEIDESAESSSDFESSESSEDNFIPKTKGSEKMSLTDKYEDKSLKKQKAHSLESQATERPNIYKNPHSKDRSKIIAADKKKTQYSSLSDFESSESSENEFETKPKNKGRNSLTDQEDVISSNRGNGHGSKGASSIKGSSKDESSGFVSDKKPIQSCSESECFSESSVSSHDDDSDDDDLSLAEKAEKTVKIKIIDAKKQKDFYLLYLEDDSINEGEFYEKSILLDGLNKHVFVTFKNAKDARAFRRTRHNEDSNITKVTIASENDFNWYSNLVAVFGFSFESKKDINAFKDQISNCLKRDVQEIIQYDEPRSLIVKFNPKHCHQAKYGDLLWKCAVEFCDIHLITAPVEKSNQILISGLSKGTDNSTVERYLSSKRHGGSRGQLSSPIKRINDHQAIATLKSVETIESILNKNNHELEGKKLKIDYFHYCLSPEVYEKHFGLDRTTKNLPKKTRAEYKPKDIKKPEDREIDEATDLQQKGDKSPKKKKSHEEEQSSKTLPATMKKNDLQKGEAERMTLKEGEKKIDAGKERKKPRKENKDTMAQVSMPLEEREKEILQSINFFEDLKIETEFQPGLLNLRGTDENIKVAKNTIFNKCYKDIKKLQFTAKNMDTTHIELLQISGVQSYINKMFKKKHYPAFLECKDDSLILHYLKEADETKLIEVVKKQIESKKMSLGDQFSIFQSLKGSEFIAQLCEDEKEKTSTIARLDQSNKSIHIVALRKYIYQAQAIIERFMEENQIHEHEVPMLRGEIEYIERFMSDTFIRTISDLLEHGISVDYSEDKIVFQGTEDGTREAEIYLSNLRDKIKAQTFQLNNFGIKEFLSDKEGKKLIDEFENLNTCVIKEDDNSSKSSPSKAKIHTVTSSATKDIACCQLRGCDIIFTCGNILEEIADGIINPLHISKKLGGGLGKAILAKGGDKIQEELNKTPMITEVKITSAGKLNNIQKIVHFIAVSLHGNLDSLKDTLQRCLLEAVKSKIHSLAIPFMVISGMLKIGKIGFFTALLQTIETFLEEEDTDNCIQKIILCDKESSNVKDIMERSEALWSIEIKNLSTIDDVGYQNSKNPQYSQELSKSQPRSQAYGQRMDAPKFGPIRVDVRKGVITKSQTDVIVFTVNENLDLKIGHIAKNILRYGGNSIQEELNNNYSSGIQVGDFAETKAGNLKCRHIVHACLSRYKGKRAEMSSLVFKILTKVNEHKFESISIPALGTGGLKYPARESALGIQEGIINFVKNHKKISLKKIMLIIYDKDTEAEKEFKSVFCPGENDDVQDNGMAEAGMASAEDYNEHESDDNKVTFGTVTLTVKCGDITQERCDAIVNGIKGSMDLTSSGSVCKSILRKCGKSFQEECSSKIEDISEDGIALTSAGKLPCKNIIHINMDKFSRSLDKGLYKALQLAEQNGYTSLSIPALGTAKKGADLSKIKKMIYSTIEKFGNTAYSLSDIRLVVYQLEMVPAFLGSSSKDLQEQARSVPISDHVDLIIFTEEKEKLQLLIQKFKRDCDLYFTKELVKMPKLENFTKEQIKKLQNEGLSHRILLKIDAAKGCVYYEGLKSNTKEVLQCIYNLHIDLANNKMLNLSKNTGVQWEYKSKEKWKKFEPLINSELETEHKRHQNLVIKDSNGRSYRVDFTKNLEYLLDSQGNVTNKTSQIRRCDLTKEEPLPTHWDSMESDETVKLVELSTKSKEYKEILKKLQTANVNFATRKIERVQNKTLYQQYSVKKREMDSRNPPGHENEKLLYHGTAFANTDPINHSGFNRNYKTVAAYGDGVYFAVDPNYSVSYAKVDPATNLHKMYLARVLVGESVVTKQGDRTPPSKPGKNYTYDSGTDGNGVMYIIFHDAQAYPDYLITF